MRSGLRSGLRSSQIHRLDCRPKMDFDRAHVTSSAVKALVSLATVLIVGCATAPPTTTPTPTASATATPAGGFVQPPGAEPTATVPPTTTPSGSGSPVSSDGGPRIVTGHVTYTNPFFTEGVAEPVIILEDQGGFVVRDRKFLIPVASQVIGQITSDFYTSPFTYSLTLPAEPSGTLRDVDHDGQTDTGVMTFAVAYWTNIWGDPFLERRDQGGGGWSTAYASTKVSDARDSYKEVYGGKYLVFAPDGNQQFPSGFGADAKLFTDDDPLMSLAAGWSVIDLDQAPFAVDRSAQPVIDLIEPASTSLDDFSHLSYSAAFDAMLQKFSTEYAFTDYKGIDWAAKGAEFRPRFVDAENAHDPHAYALALRDFTWSIPDGHIGMDQSLLNADFSTDTGGGMGFGMVETDDGKFIVNYVLAGGPAETAGMKFGAEITSVDGATTADHVAANVPWSSPFSNPAMLRLQQTRYSLRFPLSRGAVDVTFQNPGEAAQTQSIALVDEYDSLRQSSSTAGSSPTALPVEFRVLPDGLGYLQINSFLDNDVLSIQVWERAIKYFNDNQVPGVIIDMRHNSGGSGWLADQMAAYFFSQETNVGTTRVLRQVDRPVLRGSRRHGEHDPASARAPVQRAGVGSCGSRLRQRVRVLQLQHDDRRSRQDRRPVPDRRRRRQRRAVPDAGEHPRSDDDRPRRGRERPDPPGRQRRRADAAGSGHAGNAPGRGQRQRRGA